MNRHLNPVGKRRKACFRMPQQSETVCRTCFALERGLTFPRKLEASENNCITIAQEPFLGVKTDAKWRQVTRLLVLPLPARTASA